MIAGGILAAGGEAAMHEPRTLWILIADAEHARIVIPGKHAGSFQTMTRFNSESCHMRSSDLGTSPPGRSFESVGSARHAIQPKHDLHRTEAEHFAAQIAGYLTSASRLGRCNRLLLIAPARALHAIRAALDDEVASRVVGTVVKDLAKVPDHELHVHLAVAIPLTSEA
jgi:protein required for attachment to host cells